MGRGNRFRIMTAADLERIPEGRRAVVLGHFRRRLFEVTGNPELKDEIFARRREIAELFRTYGGEEHSSIADFLEGIRSPNEFDWNRPVKMPQSNRRPGYYLFGTESLGEEQIRDLRAHNRSDCKIGTATEIDIKAFFHLRNDGRPIYLTDPPTPRLMKILAVVFHARPDLRERIFWLSWDEGTMTVTPLQQGIEAPTTAQPSASTALALREEEFALTPPEVDAAGEIIRYVTHIPEVGEVYSGRVSSVGDYGFFVDILPGHSGLVHYSRVPETNWQEAYQVGDVIDVVVVEVEPRMGGRSGRVRVSLAVTGVHELIEDGRERMFVGALEQHAPFLLGGGVE